MMDETAARSHWRTDLRTVFGRHHAYYQKIGGETLRQQLAAEVAISSQYAGRSAYELLQNALDRCEQHCLIALPRDGGAPRLLVANDGRPVSYDAEFDYGAAGQEDLRAERRSDFHALCSLHTSNKSASESIGNKGVGFRSVFALSDRVQVWTRQPDASGFWGLELHRCLTAEGLAARRRDVHVADGMAAFLDQPLELPGRGRWPSFYFPIPLWSQELPDPALAELPALSTAVIVPLDAENDSTVIEHVSVTLRELASTHLHFVGLRQRGDAVVVRLHHDDTVIDRAAALGGSDDQLAWLGEWREAAAGGPLEQLARAAGHELARPGVAVGWPCRGAAPRRALYYCYLPTQVAQPLGLDVHADFQLRIDRTALLTDAREHAGLYNRTLLEVAAELHLWMVLRHLGLDTEAASAWTEWSRILARPALPQAPAAHPDIWTLLQPREGPKGEPFVEAIQRLLFGPSQSPELAETYRRWAELARAFFREGVLHERASYDAFWEATARWVDRLTGTERRFAAWRRAAKAACASLRSAGALVIPLVQGNESEVERPGEIPEAPVQSAVPLPDDRDGVSGIRAERRVFLRQSEEEASGPLVLPQQLLDRGRAVTAFTFPLGNDRYTQEITGVSEFRLLDLLRELRQLPTSLKGWRQPAPVEGAERARLAKLQEELLCFAAQLYAAKAGTRGSLQDRTLGLGWRAHLKGDAWSEELLRAGRAVATLFLPCRDGTWAPARQLTRELVEPAWLTSLRDSVPGLDPERFLTFLGVSPVAVRLVEGGQLGVVEACDAPPPLVDADREAADPLEAVWPAWRGPNLEAVERAWPELTPLIEGEVAGMVNCSLRQPLASTAWFPASLCRAPAGASAGLSLIAPEDVTLAGPHPDRRHAVLWTYPGDGPHARMLVALGALQGLSDQELEVAGARPAHRLWRQLERLDLVHLARESTARRAALELFQSVLGAVARAPDAAAPSRPLLTYAPAPRDASYGERALEWRPEGPDAWICQDNGERDRIRATFHEMPLVTATLGADRVRSLPWLAQRALQVREAIEPSPEVAGTSEAVEALRRELELLLPGLLALAEVSRLLPEGPSPADAAERWRSLRLRHVQRIAIRATASPAGRTAQERLIFDDATDDVLLDSKARAILFDTAAGSEGLPPLQSFADALSQGVLGNPVLGGLWGQAIAAYELAARRHPEHSKTARREEGLAAFRALLRRRGAASLEDSYARELLPISEESLLALRRKVDAALTPLGTRLQPWVVAPPDLRALSTEALERPAEGWGELTEESILRVLNDATWTEAERPHRPTFGCSERHRDRWNAWLLEAHRGERLMALAAKLMERNVSAPPPAPRLSLEALASQSFARLDFDPITVVRAWLGSQEAAPGWLAKVTDTASLDTRLPPPAPAFASVEQLVSLDNGALKPRVVMRRPPLDKQLKPMTRDKAHALDLSRSATGAEAEAAFLTYVLEQTRRLLAAQPEPAWDALLCAVAPGTEVHQRLERARALEAPLEEALHVSKFTDSVGYDLLGLEPDPASGAPLLVRYECKAASKESSFELHVSANELAAFARWRLGQFAGAGPVHGTWRLVAVGRDGLAQDLLLPLKLADGDATRLDGVHRDGERGPRKVVMV